MTGLDRELSRVVAQALPDAAYALKVGRNRAAYMRAVRATWFHSTAAAEMILDHTNAFYVRRDDRPRIGPDADKPCIVGEVCIHDSTVRSEVNARLEMLKGALADEGVIVEELRIVTATWGMKKRHPFAGRGAPPARDAIRSKGREQAASPAVALQVVKRAFCLVFGEGAESVLSRVGRASVEDAPCDRMPADARQAPWCFCHLYSADADFPRLVEAYEGPLVSAARTLGLNLASIEGHFQGGLVGEGAFPAVGYPHASERLDAEGVVDA